MMMPEEDSLVEKKAETYKKLKFKIEEELPKSV